MRAALAGIILALLAACAAHYHIRNIVEARALSDKGLSLFEAGDYAGAKAALDAAIAFGTLDDRDYTRRAAVEGAMKQYDKALADTDKALAIAPQEWRTHLQRAIFHQHLKQFDAAIHDLDLAISENSSQADLLRRRAYLKIVNGRFGDAITDYDALAKKGPGGEAGILGRGVGLYLEGKWREAADVFGGILETDPGDGLTALWYVKASLRAGLPVEWRQFAGHTSDDPSWTMTEALLTADDIATATARTAQLANHGGSPCEESLFLGAWRVTRANGDGASNAFQAAEKQCPADSIEGAEARAEAARLK